MAKTITASDVFVAGANNTDDKVVLKLKTGKSTTSLTLSGRMDIEDVFAVAGAAGSAEDKKLSESFKAGDGGHSITRSNESSGERAARAAFMMMTRREPSAAELGKIMGRAGAPVQTPPALPTPERIPADAFPPVSEEPAHVNGDSAPAPKRNGRKGAGASAE